MAARKKEGKECSCIDEASTLRDWAACGGGGACRQCGTALRSCDKTTTLRFAIYTLGQCSKMQDI